MSLEYVTIKVGVAKHSWTSWPRPLQLCPNKAFSKVGNYGTEIGPNFWGVVNGDRVTNIAFRSTDTYPDVAMLDGVIAEIRSASADQSNLIVNITSVLSVSNMSILNGATVRCEDLMTSSESLNISTHREFIMVF